MSLTNLPQLLAAREPGRNAVLTKLYTHVAGRDGRSVDELRAEHQAWRETPEGRRVRGVFADLAARARIARPRSAPAAWRPLAAAREPARPSASCACSSTACDAGDDSDPPASEPPPSSGVERAVRVAPTARADGYARGLDGTTSNRRSALSAPELLALRRAGEPVPAHCPGGASSVGVPAGGPVFGNALLDRLRTAREDEYWANLTRETIDARARRQAVQAYREALSLGGSGGQSHPVRREAPTRLHTKKIFDRTPDPHPEPRPAVHRSREDTSRYLYPPLRMNIWEFKDAVGAKIAAYAAALPHGKRRTSLLRKATALRLCGTFTKIRACKACSRPRCGSGVLDAGSRSFPCNSRSCSICSRRTAQRLRRRLSYALDVLSVPSGWSYKHITFTMPYRPDDEADLTIEALRLRAKSLLRAISCVWKKGLRQRGAAMCIALECAGGGNVHAHVLYLGPYIDKAWLDRTTAEAGGGFTDIRRPVEPGDDDWKRVVLEIAKYPLKGPSPLSEAFVEGRSRDVTNPEIAARWEIATDGMHLHKMLGVFRGIEMEEEAAVREAEDDARDVADDADQKCEHCGIAAGFEWRRVPTIPWVRYCHAVGSPALHRSRWLPPSEAP